MAKRRTPLEVAQASEKSGDLAKAADAYAQHLKANGSDTRILLHLGELQERLGQSAAAAKTFRQLSDLHLADGFRAKAASALRRAWKLRPQDAEIASLLAGQLFGDGKKRDAIEVLESTAAAVRDAPAARLALLRQAAELDGGAATHLSLAAELAAADKLDEARETLRALAQRLRSQGARADEILVLERLLEISGPDLPMSIAAARGALELREPKRTLTIVRRALDTWPEDGQLEQLAAEALEELGEEAAATIVYRDIARRMTREGARVAALEAWRSVQQLLPEDAEARSAIAPPVALDVGKLLGRRGQALEDLGDSEIEGVVSSFHERPAQPATGADEPLLELSMEEAEGLTIEPDPQITPAAIPEHAPPPAIPFGVVVDESAGEAPLPKRALIIGSDPDAGWAAQALGDVGLDVASLPGSELSRAVERGLELERDLIVAPAALAQAIAEASKSWRVLALTWADRIRVREWARECGLPSVETLPVAEPAELLAAFETLGSPLHLVAAEGAPLEVSRGAPGFQLALARQRLSGALFAQPALGARVSLLLAGDGAQVAVLGEWRERGLDDVRVCESPAGEGESERRTLGERLARAVRLRGLAVVALAQLPNGGWSVDGLEESLGPGTLAIEARSGSSLFSVALDLLCGKACPAPSELRGAAISARIPAGTLSSVASLRIETGGDGATYVCAHAPDIAQAERRLRRALAGRLARGLPMTGR